MAYPQEMKPLAWGTVGGLILSVGAFVPSALAEETSLEPDAIVSCDVGGTDLRGVEVCYLTATLTRGENDLDVDDDFGLFFQDESAAFGDGSAGFTIRVGMAEVIGGAKQDPFPFTPPEGGDILSTTVLYPVVDRVPVGEVEGLRGTDIAAGVFAVTSAADFSYTKTLESEGEKSWVRFDINKTHIDIWFRDECEFGDFDEDAGIFAPKPECEVENGFGANGDDPGIVSQSDVTNDVAFYTPETFGICEECGETESFVNERTDSGYLNYAGRGLTWYTDGPAFQFQIVGPRFAGGQDLNTGSLQAFLPTGYMQEIFGEDFDPNDPAFLPQRFDVGSDGLEVEDLSETIQASARNGGLLIELASYPFSAPAFSFAAPSPEPVVEDAAETTSAPREKKVAPVVEAPTLAATGPTTPWQAMASTTALLLTLGAALVVTATTRRRLDQARV